MKYLRNQADGAGLPRKICSFWHRLPFHNIGPPDGAIGHSDNRMATARYRRAQIFRPLFCGAKAHEKLQERGRAPRATGLRQTQPQLCNRHLPSQKTLQSQEVSAVMGGDCVKPTKEANFKSFLIDVVHLFLIIYFIKNKMGKVGVADFAEDQARWMGRIELGRS